MNELRIFCEVASELTGRKLRVWASKNHVGHAKLYEIKGKSSGGGTLRMPLTGEWPVKHIHAFLEGMLA